MLSRSSDLSRSGSSNSGCRIGCMAGVLSELCRRLDHERMDEGLREISSHLVLAGVVLLAEQLRRSGGRAGALEPGARLDSVALVVQGECDQEAAQQERALGLV